MRNRVPKLSPASNRRVMGYGSGDTNSEMVDLIANSNRTIPYDNVPTSTKKLRIKNDFFLREEELEDFICSIGIYLYDGVTDSDVEDIKEELSKFIKKIIKTPGQTCI